MSIPEPRADTKDASYAQRQSVPNKGELLFEEYCRGKGIQFFRFGFDEKGANIPLFFHLHKALRALPDYIVPMPADDTLWLVHVKGTNKLKADDLALYEEFYWRYDQPHCHLVIYFCFEGRPPYTATIPRIRQLIEDEHLELKRFPNDGKEYFDLPIDHLRPRPGA